MGRWLTPDAPPVPVVNKIRTVSVPDTMIGFVSGALFLLTLEENWEPFGGLTAQQTADIFLKVYEDYINS